MKILKKFFENRKNKKQLTEYKRLLSEMKQQKDKACFNQIYDANDERSAEQLLDNIFDKHHGV